MPCFVVDFRQEQANLGIGRRSSSIKMFVPVMANLLTDLIMETTTTEPNVLLVLKEVVDIHRSG